MSAEFNSPDSRDRAIARAVARSVRSSRTDGPGTGPRDGPGKGPLDNDACPDASLVAAYADQALADGERAHLENHFAACERCQQTLAALGVAIEAADVAVMPAPAVAQPRTAPSSKHWLWWLSPAFGAAAAALLWMVLRPSAPAPVQTAANYSTEGPGERPREEAAQELRMKGAPAAPSVASESPAPAIALRRDAETLDRMSKAATEAKQLAADTQGLASTATAADAVAPPAPSQPPVRSEIATMAAPPPAAPPASNIPAPVSQGNAAPRPSPRAAAEQSATVSAFSIAQGAAPAAQAAGNAAIAAPVAAPQTGYSYTFNSPEGGAQWRLGVTGLIEKSTDNGRTWQRQPTGGTVDLLAGSASSNQVAWVVGRAGVILRTTDGQQWQRIPAPAGVNDDWVAVVAYSADSATLVGPIRRFATVDGGMTWTEQQ